MQITIDRERLFNGYGLRFPYSWLYIVTVPETPYPFQGKGIDWARALAKKKSKVTGYPVKEIFDTTESLRPIGV